MNVGGGVSDYVAAVAPDHFINVEGSFDKVTGVTTVTDSVDGDNHYTLQMNTNAYYPLPEYCAGCQGWQQFAYWNHGADSKAWIESFIINWDQPTCPWGGSPSGGICVHDSAPVSVPEQTIADLPNLRLRGLVNDNFGNDWVFFRAGNGTWYSTSQPASTAYLTDRWSVVEYNILGYALGSTGISSTTQFNLGSTIVVRIDVTSFGVNNLPPQVLVPACGANGTPTAEWNNLNLIPPCCPRAGSTLGPVPSRGITFTESNAPGALPAFCAAWDHVPILSVLR